MIKPWKWEQRLADGSFISEWTLNGPEKVLCRFWYDAPPSAEALLIQKAPELLEALVDILALGRNGRLLNPKYDAFYERAKQLIESLKSDV